MEKLLKGHLSSPNVIPPLELHSFLTHFSLLSFISVTSSGYTSGIYCEVYFLPCRTQSVSSDFVLDTFPSVCYPILCR